MTPSSLSTWNKYYPEIGARMNPSTLRLKLYGLMSFMGESMKVSLMTGSVLDLGDPSKYTLSY